MSAASTTTLPIRAFLKMRALSCVSRDGERGMVLALGDTAGLFPEGIAAQWLGLDAAAFFDAHLPELVPGRCLDLEIYHLRPVHNELRARIKSCALAPLPQSWLKHAEKTHPSTQEQPSA